MFLWEDTQRAVDAARQKAENPNVLVCPKCGGDFFSVEEFKQYRVDRVVGLSQRPAHHPSSPTFYFFRCVCGEVIEPPLSMFGNNKMTEIYGKFVSKLKEYLGSGNKIT
jgi:hypothetical protein